MGLETTNVITGLEPAYPTTGDAIQQGDDHIRLLKTVLKHCFPNVNAPLTASMIPNVPAGGIAATTLQAAIDELDSEKASKDGTGVTGTWGISISGNAATATNATNAVNATNATNATNAANASAVADGAVSSSAKLANNIVTNAKLARDGAYGQLLTSQGAGADPIWANPPAGGVSSFNGRTGAVTQAYSDIVNALGYAPISGISKAGPGVSMVYSGTSVKSLISNSSIIVGDNGNGSVSLTLAQGTGACLHPYTQVLTDTGPKFLLDLRPGDKVLTSQGFDTVLGVWESVLGERSLVCVNGKAVCTPGHLWMLDNGDIAAYDVAEYEEKDRGTERPVKLLSGMRVLYGADYEGVRKLQIGDVIQTTRGPESVTSIECFELKQNFLPMYSIVLENAHAFFADGVLVGTLD